MNPISFDGDKYWRGKLSFMTWSVRSRVYKERVVKRSDPLVQDYMLLEKARDR